MCSPISLLQIGRESILIVYFFFISVDNFTYFINLCFRSTWDIGKVVGIPKYVLPSRVFIPSWQLVNVYYIKFSKEEFLVNKNVV